METILPRKVIQEYIKRKKIGDSVYYFIVCPCCQAVLSNSEEYIVGFHTKEDSIKALEKFIVDKAKEHLTDSFNLN